MKAATPGLLQEPLDTDNEAKRRVQAEVSLRAAVEAGIREVLRLESDVERAPVGDEI